jgi:two-component system sensor histidine kinase KdpD
LDTASRSSIDRPVETRADAGRRGAVRRPAWGALAGWLAAAALCTVALWVFRLRVESAHMALVYLLVVLLGSATHGRVVGFVLAVACFLAFNFFLLPPYYTLALHESADLWVLLAFLLTGTVAAQLLHRAQRALDVAESRARELDRLAAMTAESLSAPRAVDAVRAIARVVRAELPVDSCRIVMLDPLGAEVVAEGEVDDDPAESAESELSMRAARERLIMGSCPDGSFRVASTGATLSSLSGMLPDISELIIPLLARERVVGMLVLRDARGLRLDAERARFADALTYYAALSVERVRLAKDSEHVAALLEADRIKDAVLASVSHDLRTPLTSIQALAAELRGSGDERAVIIEEEAVRLNRMVTDLLDLSRIRTGSLPVEPQLVAAEDVVGAALQRIGDTGGGDRVDVRLPADGSLPVGRIDFSHTLRVLVNLLENALRHSPAGARVELDVEQTGDDLLLRVLDRGPGVPEADRLRIFEPFFHGRPGTGIPGRSGLGLAIARSLAAAQGGAVEYRPREGGGSVFEVRLPAESISSVLR